MSVSAVTMAPNLWCDAGLRTTTLYLILSSIQTINENSMNSSSLHWPNSEMLWVPRQLNTCLCKKRELIWISCIFSWTFYNLQKQTPCRPKPSEQQNHNNEILPRRRIKKQTKTTQPAIVQQPKEHQQTWQRGQQLPITQQSRNSNSKPVRTQLPKQPRSQPQWHKTWCKLGEKRHNRHGENKQCATISQQHWRLKWKTRYMHIYIYVVESKLGPKIAFFWVKTWSKSFFVFSKLFFLLQGEWDFSKKRKKNKTNMTLFLRQNLVQLCCTTCLDQVLTQPWTKFWLNLFDIFGPFSIFQNILKPLFL